MGTWQNDYRKRIQDPDTPPKEADRLCSILVDRAARGDEEAERAIAVLAIQFIGDSKMPKSLIHHLSLMFSYRVLGQKWERAAQYRKYDTLNALRSPKQRREDRRWWDERDVIEAVKCAQAIGHPMSITANGKKTAFEVAAERLKELWGDGRGRARGRAGTLPTPDNVRRIWYRHKRRVR